MRASVITDGVLAGLNKPAALIGIAEKGYLSVVLQTTLRRAIRRNHPRPAPVPSA